MADKENQSRLEEAVQSEKATGRRRFRIGRLGGFLLLTAAVLIVVLAAAWRDGTGFDAIHRRLTYGSGEAADKVGYVYDAASNNRFAVLGDYLAVLSGAQLSLQSDTETLWTIPVHMTTPALVSNGTRAAAWDVGGEELYVAGISGEELSLREEEPLIAATLNRSGWLAVTAEEANHKGKVTVYDSTLKPVFAFHSSEHFVVTACVTEDCSRLAAVTLGQDAGTFASRVVFYNLTEKDPYAASVIPDAMAMAVGSVDSAVTVAADTKLAFLSVSGDVQATYDYNGSYLREYDLTGDGFAALLLSQYKSGSLGRLVTVDSSGKELASLEINRQVLHISSAGRYLAVLYADRCVIYTQYLEEYAVQDNMEDIKSVQMRTDGSALLLASDKATLFLP